MDAAPPSLPPHIDETVRTIADFHLEHAREATEDPAVAARPENFFAVGFEFSKIRRVAIVEVLVLVVEKVGGLPPILDGEIEIGLPARRLPEAHPRGRSHEKRIAPPVMNHAQRAVELATGRCRVREDRVETRDGGRKHRGFVVLRVESEIGLRDAVVVGVVNAAAGFPLVVGAHLHHRVVEPRTA